MNVFLHLNHPPSSSSSLSHSLNPYQKLLNIRELGFCMGFSFYNVQSIHIALKRVALEEIFRAHRIFDLESEVNVDDDDMDEKF